MGGGGGREAKETNLIYRRLDMRWSEIKVGSDYIIRSRKVEGDDREFIGFHVVHKTSDQTASGRNRTLKGNIFTNDGTYSEGDLVGMNPDSIIDKWIRTAEQKAKEDELKAIVDEARLLVEKRIIDVAERLDWRLGGNQFISRNKRKVEIGLTSIRDSAEECSQLVAVLDKLYEALG
jgi:hypothetical protein